MSDIRPVPPELEEGFQAHRFGDRIPFDTVAYKLSEANPDVFSALMEMSHGLGEPSTD